MMVNFPIEISGLTTIIMKEVHFERMMNNDWVRLSDGKVVNDNHMMARVKRMMHKNRIVEEAVQYVDTGKEMKLSRVVPCYRAWFEEGTLNIEKLYYNDA